jgi:VIT1/CCC1 family predicted Fe2+/Mn2+ transporter
MSLPKALYIRNFVFGVEDSLASTVGLLSGVAAAGLDRETIIIAGVILIFVEAFSMAVGSFVSEESAEEYVKQSDVPARKPLIGGVVMFFSYFASGFIPLLPYSFMEVSLALKFSIIFSLLSLFLLGLIQAKLANTDELKHGIKMLFIGGIAVMAGVVIGGLLRIG